MTTLLYGQLIGRSVVREKTAKTVEIMLSSVSVRQLMFGKILGLGLAGLVQYGFWIAVSLCITVLAGPILDLPPPPAHSAATTVAAGTLSDTFGSCNLHNGFLCGQDIQDRYFDDRPACGFQKDASLVAGQIIRIYTWYGGPL